MVLQLHKKEKKRETFEKYRLCSEMFEAIIITFSRKITVNAKKITVANDTLQENHVTTRHMKNELCMCVCDE